MADASLGQSGVVRRREEKLIAVYSDGHLALTAGVAEAVGESGLVARRDKSAKSPPRIAVVCDLPEENWPSMDLVGEMLYGNLIAGYADTVKATRVRPQMARRFSYIYPLCGKRTALNADRLLNRFWDYPRLLKSKRGDFELFHLVDHSYSQLVHQLPPSRTIVTCHDIDTFRCLLEPSRHPRSGLFRMMTRHSLNGLRKAAMVTCDSVATRDELLAYDIVPPERTVVIPNGVHPACTSRPVPVADAEASRLLGPIDSDSVDILHVGSTIPRKRIDVLLRVFAALKEEAPKLRLIRVGGQFTDAQATLADRLHLTKSIITLPYLERDVLAAVYRRASVVLLTSDSEGFGLPVAEAMACGTSVVASDLAVLREVGGMAAVYCRVGDVQAWTHAVLGMLADRQHHHDKWLRRVAANLTQSAKFSWEEYTGKIVQLYSRVLEA